MPDAAGRAGRRLDDAQRLAWLRLIRSENVGPATFRALINRFGSAAAALDALPELSARGGLRRRIRIAGKDEAAAELAAAQRLGVRLVALGEPDYPPALAHAEGGPPLLYVRGDAAVLAAPCVAVVGSRNCSAAGRRIAQEIAAGLGASGLAIVSGLARGIDLAAHTAALDTGTVAVLAGGVDVIYPKEHETLYARILDRGAAVSEMPLGLEPRGRDFPRRNRIIAGMALGIVVVEAARRSGSLITARLAGEAGRDVLAVPGSPLDPRAEGTNRLIRDGATLVRHADDILEALAPVLADPARALGAAPAELPPGGPDGVAAGPPDDWTSVAATARERVAGALGPSPVGIDDVVRHTGLPAGQVHVVLLELELAGRLSRHPGHRVSLLDFPPFPPPAAA